MIYSRWWDFLINANSDALAARKSFNSAINLFIAGIIAFLFLAAFFYFFIRPYSYRWKPCYGFKAYGVCMPSGFPVSYTHLDVYKRQGIDNVLLSFGSRFQRVVYRLPS